METSPTSQNQAMEVQPSPSEPTPSPPQSDPYERPSSAYESVAPSLPTATHYPPVSSFAERPYTAHGTSSALRRPAFSGPYLTASARTSFTHVDIDVTPTIGSYPPLPNLSHLLSGIVASDTVVDNQAETNASPAADAHAVQVPQTPQVFLTFLLVSGRRRTMSFDPAITVGRVKELVWNAWPTDWQDESPSTPSHLRILYLGKILQDEDTLTHLSFPTSLPTPSSSPPTIVHLSIRPSNITTVDDTMKKKRLSNVFPRRGTSNTVTDMAHDGADDARGTGCCSGCIIC